MCPVVGPWQGTGRRPARDQALAARPRLAASGPAGGAMAVEIDPAVPFLDVADQAPSVRSAQVRRARQASRHARDDLRTGGAAARPRGAADQAPEAAAAEQAVARPSRHHLRAICRLVGELGAQPGSRTIRAHSRLVVAASQPGSAAGSRIWPMWPASCSQTAWPASSASASAPAVDRPHQRGEPLDDRTPRRLVAVTRASPGQ